MKLKNISRLLTFGVLLNSIPINSFAGVLSEDARYETFTDSDITINDVLEEDKTDVKVKGDSLVNLNTKPQATFWTNINSSEYNVQTDNYSKINGTINTNQEGLYAYLRMGTLNINLFKPNTTYTVVFDNIKGAVGVSFQNGSGTVSLVENRSNIINNMVTITTKAEFPDLTNQTLYLYVQLLNRNVIAPTKFICENAMIFEGDLTNNPPTNYFEGLQSSFENQLVTQEMVDTGKEKAEYLGKYKAQITTAGGKNLFNKNSVYDHGWIDFSTGLFNEANKDNYVSDFIKVEPNTIYMVSPIESYAYTWMYDINYNYLGNVRGEKIITNEDCYYIRLGYSIATSAKPGRLDSIQIEKGDKITPYEPYKESINTFYLNSPLLEGDTIEYIDGVPNHVHRRNQIEFDGSDDENWYKPSEEGAELVNTVLFRIHVDNWGNYCISDNFVSGTVGDSERVGAYTGAVAIRINKSRLSEINAIKFKEWLSENPTTMIYHLENPIYEPIKADLSVQLFEGTTHISNNSNIPTIMEVTVDRTLNRAVEHTELAKTNPTINNLSKARYWNNLLKDSIKKDQLQEEVNNITRLNDMELERKTATSNLDLYIKCENILMMSLSTNNITFEDFSGVEDMTKENAVQISINSSLPYSLNAYLPTEIQNSDKLATMNKDILNIKENSESAYQTFINTTDKIILKDNNQAGNDLIHNIDIKLKGGIAHQKDVYKTTIKFEAEQK